MSDGGRKEWIREKDFTENGITVRVNKLPLYMPKYSVAMGIVREDGSLSVFIPYEMQTGSDKAANAGVVARLYADAEAYIHEECTKRREEIKRIDDAQKARREQEERDLKNRQERNARKKSNHEANRERRRQENRARADRRA